MSLKDTENLSGHFKVGICVFIILGIYIPSPPFETNNQVCLAVKAQKNLHLNVRGFVCLKDTSWGGLQQRNWTGNIQEAAAW